MFILPCVLTLVESICYILCVYYDYYDYYYYYYYYYD